MGKMVSWCNVGLPQFYPTRGCEKTLLEGVLAFLVACT
jgi:hypothetical protein